MRHLLGIVVLVIGCLYSVSAPAAVDVFLKLDGIPGESTDDRHKNEVDVISLTHQLSAGPAQARPAVSGKLLAPMPGVRSVGPITITKYVDVASPLLMTRFVSGEKIATAVVTMRKPGGQPIEFLKANLQGVSVVGYEMSVGSGQGLERPTETVTLSFDSIEWQYVKQNADGSAGAATTASYTGR